MIDEAVRSIEKMYDRLHQLVPEARIGIAHGQMRENALEDVMLEIMFDIPSDPTVEKVVVTPACVRGECGPEIIHGNARAERALGPSPVSGHAS